MKRIGILKPSRLVDLLNWLGIPTVIVYLLCMFAFPWIDGNCSWTHVQNVWDRWQALNVGMLAFISSVVAFNISRFNANEQRQRDFLAAKAFLPAALSELVAYFKSSASVFNTAWELKPGQGSGLKAPSLPEEYKEVFAQCIRYAAPDVGDYLSQILIKLQVHDARISDFVSHFDDSSYINPDKYNLITYFYRLGELQALVSKLFEFARGSEEFDPTPLEWEDYRNAFGNLDIFYEEIHIDEQVNLAAFTKRAIQRSENKVT